MVDTFFEVPKEKSDRFTPLYFSNKKDGYELIESVNNSPYVKEVTFCNPAGGLVSTMNDISNFCEMLLNNGVLNGKRILEEETVALMTKDHLNKIKNGKPSNDNHKPNDAMGFGLSFNVLKDINSYPFPGSEVVMVGMKIVWYLF